MEQKQQLPNATAVLILGICSIVFSCIGIGFILGIIGLVLSVKDRKLYRANPFIYDGYSNLMAGFVTSIIGMSIGSIWVFIIIAWVIAEGVVFSLTNLTN